MSSYTNDIKAVSALVEAKGSSWDPINPESVARMRAQNKFKTGLDIAQYTADIMNADMAAFDADNTKYTQSLGCWHGFIGQQTMISIKKHFGGKTDRRYLYLSGWMVAALRSDFGPLPDQSMHEKTAVASLVEELYTFLRQADARELGGLFRDLDAAREAGDAAKEASIQDQIDNHVTHVVPIIADIDAGFGNAEATYLMAKQMIEAGACCLQIENQVADEKQCGHQDGKVTVPHADFHSKIRALRHAFLELGIDNGLIVARTDSEGAGLTKEIAVVKAGADLLWIETATPSVKDIADMMNEVRKEIPDAKLVYNNSPSFNWTLNFRQQAYDRWVEAGKDVSAYDRGNLMSVDYDDSELAADADDKVRSFQADSAREANIFHHLITLPTYHTAALSTDNLAKEYFGDQGMLGYVAGVQRKEIRQGIACVKHQNMSGSDIGDDHKEYFAGENALKAGGEKNTSNQFS
mgnify:CR=1 FL=1